MRYLHYTKNASETLGIPKRELILSLGLRAMPRKADLIRKQICSTSLVFTLEFRKTSNLRRSLNSYATLALDLA